MDCPIPSLCDVMHHHKRMKRTKGADLETAALGYEHTREEMSEQCDSWKSLSRLHGVNSSPNLPLFKAYSSLASNIDPSVEPIYQLGWQAMSKAAQPPTAFEDAVNTMLQSSAGSAPHAPPLFHPPDHSAPHNCGLQLPQYHDPTDSPLLTAVTPHRSTSPIHSHGGCTQPKVSQSRSTATLSSRLGGVDFASTSSTVSAKPVLVRPRHNSTAEQNARVHKAAQLLIRARE